MLHCLHKCTHPVPLGSTQPVGRSESLEPRTPGADTKLPKAGTLQSITGLYYASMPLHFEHTFSSAFSPPKKCRKASTQLCVAARPPKQHGAAHGNSTTAYYNACTKCSYCYKARSALRHLRRLRKLGLRCQHAPACQEHQKRAWSQTPLARCSPSRACAPPHGTARTARPRSRQAPKKISGVHCTTAGAVRRRRQRR